MRKIITLLLCLALLVCAAAESAGLSRGSRGAQVEALQARLKELGYYAMNIDGDYGNGTVAAVTAFQARNGLTQDGAAGPETLAALYSDGALPAPVAPGVEIVSVTKGDRDTFLSFRLRNNLDEPVTYIEYWLVPYVGEEVSSVNPFGSDDLLSERFYEPVSVEPGAEAVVEYSWSQYHVQRYTSLAVGIYAWRTASGAQTRLAAEQVTFRRSDGTVLWPQDEQMAVRTLSEADETRARGVRFGLAARPVEYYASRWYMLPRGHYVTRVEEGSMAAEAGLQWGDVIEDLDGDPITFPYAEEYAKLRLLAGEAVEVRYWRANQAYTTTFQLGG